MKALFSLWAALGCGLTVLQAASPLPVATTTSFPANLQQARFTEQYAQLPLYFEPNQGQTDPRVDYLARAGGYLLFLTPGEAVMMLSDRTQRAVVRMKLEGARSSTPVNGLTRVPGISAYFRGNDPKKWQPEVPHYARVQYKDVYPGVDLVYYGDRQQVEYDFNVTPGADPSQIRLAYDGVDSLRVDAHGDLVLATRLGVMKQRKPRVYQDIAGRRVELAANYRLEGRSVGMEIAAYDHKRPLVIDPALVYSTYLGATGWPYAIAVGSDGAAYVTGWSTGTGFPIVNAYQSVSTDGSDVFVTKLNPNNGVGAVTLAYSTFIGAGAREGCEGHAIAVDPNGAAYVAALVNDNVKDGYYASTYPVTTKLGPQTGDAFGSAKDAYVTKLNPNNGSGPVSLGYSTRVGGGGYTYATAIAVDASGSAYLAGTSGAPDFPTVSAFQPKAGGGWDAYVLKLNSGGTAAVYWTYLGGSGDESVGGITVDSTGAAYVAGTTTSSDFPVLYAFQKTWAGLWTAAFVTKLSPSGSSVAYSTYLGSVAGAGGGNVSAGNVTVGGIAIDPAGAAYVAGYTFYRDWPVVNAYQPVFLGVRVNDAFVTKINACDSTHPCDASHPVTLGYSTYLAGSTDTQVANGIAVDATGAAYVVGTTASTDFPLLNAWQSSVGRGALFLTKFNPNDGLHAVTLGYSTLLGGNNFQWAFGIAVDATGAIYVAGGTQSPDFPTANAYQEDFGFSGTEPPFVIKFAASPH